MGKQTFFATGRCIRGVTLSTIRVTFHFPTLLYSLQDFVDVLVAESRRIFPRNI